MKVANEVMRSLCIALSLAGVGIAGGGCAPEAPDTTVPKVTITSPAEGTIFNSSSVTVSGTATDSGGNLETVRVQVGTVTGTATLDAGAFTATLTAVPNGNAAVLVTAIDAGGFTSTAGPVGIVVDAAAPVVTIVGPADQARLGGPDDADAASGFQVQVTVSVEDVSGTGVSGQTVTVSDASGVVGTGTISGTSADVLCTLVEGESELTAAVSDIAGNAGTSAAVTVSVDLTPPTAAISAIAAGPVFGAAETFAQSGVADALDITVLTNAEAGQPVTLFRNGVAHPTTANSSGAQAIFQNVPLSEGANDFTASVSDLHGNASGVSAAYLTTYDSVNPTISVNAIATGPAFSAAEAQAQSGVADRLDVIVSTDAENGQVVSLFRNGTAASVPTAVVGNSQAVFEDVTIANGSNAFTASVSDAAGNPSGTSATYATTYDNAAPTISVQTIATGPLFSAAEATTQSSVANALDVTVLTNAESGQPVTLFRNGVAHPGTSSSNGTQAVFQDVPLSQGANDFTASVSDQHGNTSGVSAPYQTTYDSVNPTISVNAIATGPSFSAAEAQVQSGVADRLDVTVSTDAENGRVVSLFRNGVAASVPTAVVSDSQAVFEDVTIANGSNAFTASVSDLAGNPSGLSAAYNTTYDDVAPTVSVQTIATGPLFSAAEATAQSSVANALDVTILTDAESGQPVTLFRNGVAHGSTAASNGSQAVFQNVPLSEGANDFTASVSDLHGNSSGLSAPYLTTYDSANPTISVDAIATGPAFSAAEALTQSGTADRLDVTVSTDAENGRTVSLFVNGAPASVPTAVASNSQAFFDDVAVANGPNDFTASVADLAGNPSGTSATYATTYDNAAPTISVQTIASGPLFSAAEASAQSGVANALDVTVLTDAEAGQPVTLFRNGVAHPGTSSSNGTQAVFQDVPLSQGANDFTASVSDFHGNSSGLSAAYATTYDSANPTISVNAIATGPAFSAAEALAQSGFADRLDVTVSTDAENGRTVSLFVNGAPASVPTAVVSNSQAFFDDVTVANGANDFTASVSDLSGNPSGTSAIYATTYDNLAPSISHSIPLTTVFNPLTSGAQSGGGPGRIDITLATDAEDGQPVTLFKNGVVAGVENAGGGTALFEDVLLVEGTNSFTAFVEDAHGNGADTTGAPYVTRYDSILNLSVSEPTAGQSFSAADDVSSAPGVQITFAASTDAEDGRMVTFASGVSSVDVPVANSVAVVELTLTEGLQDFTVSVRDVADNFQSVDVLGVRLDTVAPSFTASSLADLVLLTSVDDESPVTARLQKTVTVDVSDIGGSGFGGQSVTFQVNGRLPSVTAPVDGSGQASAVLDLLDGSNTIVTTVTDAAGNAAAPVWATAQVISGPLADVTGRVENATGVPVADAQVQLAVAADFSAIIRTAVTGTDGMYTLVDVPAGRYELLRASDDFDGNSSFFEPGLDRIGDAPQDLIVTPEAAFFGITAPTLVLRPYDCDVTGTVQDDPAYAANWGVTPTWVALVTARGMRSSTLVSGGSWTLPLSSATAGEALIYGKDTDGSGGPSLSDPRLESFDVALCGSPPFSFTLPPPVTVSGTVSGGAGFRVELTDGVRSVANLPVDPASGEYEVTGFGAPSMNVIAFLDMDADLEFDDSDELSISSSTLDGLPDFADAAQVITGIDVAIPAIRLVEGTLLGTTDFRVRAQDLLSPRRRLGWQEPVSGSFTVQTFPGTYELQAYDEVNANGSSDPGEHLEFGSADTTGGDDLGIAVIMRPDLRLVSVTAADNPPDGSRDTLPDAGDTQGVTLHFRNRGGDVTGFSGTISETETDATMIAAGPTPGIAIPSRQLSDIPGYQWSILTTASIGERLTFGFDGDGFDSVGVPYSIPASFEKLVGGVLLVDDDASNTGLPDHAGVYEGALGTFDFETVVVNGPTDLGPDAATMDAYGATVWFTGEAAPSLESGDETEIQTLLDNPERRFVLFSPHYAGSFDTDPDPGTGTVTSAGSFVFDYMRVFFVAAELGGFSDFAAGDDIANGDPPGLATGMFFGMENDQGQDTLQCIDNGTLWDQFVLSEPIACQSTSVGASGNSKSVMLTLGLEATPDPGSRTELMRRALTFGPNNVVFDFDTGFQGWTTVNSSPTVIWDVDGLPSPVAGISDAFVSGPNSLNFNDDTDFSDGTIVTGSATSPEVDLFIPGTLTFACNYQTEDPGLTFDQRVVRVSNDGFASFLINDQLSTNGSPLGGACASMGTWHTHTYSLDPAWGDVQVRFFFNSIDNGVNDGDGWFVDDVTVSF